MYVIDYRTGIRVLPSTTTQKRKAGTDRDEEIPPMSTWTFITNHARVLLVITHDPKVRLRDIASTLDITERAAQRIVTELVEEGYLSRKREGRRNVYTVHPNQPMRAPQARGTEVGQFLEMMLANQDPTSAHSR
jgi:predicted DNA-binding transcriptional regulator